MRRNNRELISPQILGRTIAHRGLFARPDTCLAVEVDEAEIVGTEDDGWEVHVTAYETWEIDEDRTTRAVWVDLENLEASLDDVVDCC